MRVMRNLVSVHLETVLVLVQDRHTVCTKRTVGWHPTVLLGDKAQWKLISIRLEIVLILTQDRCTVSNKHTIGSEIILDAPDGTRR